jgi:hypothetical protein
MMQDEEILRKASVEEKRKGELLKKENVDLGSKDGFRIAYLAEKRKEPTPMETERFRSALSELNVLISKANGMDEKVLFSVAEMIEKGDAKGIGKMFEKNPEAAKAASAVVENREMCDFVVRNAYANMAFSEEFGKIKDVRGLLKAHIAVRKDPKFKALIEEFRKDDKFKAVEDKTDPLILYMLMKNLLPNLMASGMFGGMLRSFFGKIMGKFGISVESSERNVSLIGSMAKAISVFGTPDGFVPSQIMEGMLWKR